MATATIRSPLRYPGGKTRAIRQIMPIIPERFLEYREPFIGGGSVLFALYGDFGTSVSNYWINDLNYDLYCFWKIARDCNDELVDKIRHLKNKIPDGRELYHYLRQPENMRTDFDLAVRFFIMNRITFSGVVDSGGYSAQSFNGRFTESSIERLSFIDAVLQDVEISHGDYVELLEAPGDDVFIFLDPPYYTATNSRLYGVKGELHTGFDHERFAADMQACKHKWLITYDDSDYIRELFDFADIVPWNLQYGMNNYKQDTAAKGKELFIKNY